TTDVTPPGPGEARALCIGLNGVDPNAYGGWDGELSGCINDANDMESIAGSRGFKVAKLLNERATRQTVLDAIAEAGRASKRGDIFMISYSGHGGQVASDNPTSGYDNTWCLYDGQLIDDRIGFQLSKFPAGVRIIVFLDSCH